MEHNFTAKEIEEAISCIIVNDLEARALKFLSNKLKANAEKVKTQVVPKLQKVDDQLTIEFTDIKQEPKNQFDDMKNHESSKDGMMSKCISCNSYFTDQKCPNGTATIHETCFQKLCTKLYLANEKKNPRT